jgi:hypothetical protein
MRIQDKIMGQKLAKNAGGTGKMSDELPVPHHSGYVKSAVEDDGSLVYGHQKVQS